MTTTSGRILAAAALAVLMLPALPLIAAWLALQWLTQPGLSCAKRNTGATVLLGMEDHVELLARHLHEAGREAVEAGAVVNKVPGRFLEWAEISDDAREGRRMQARYLIGRGLINLAAL